MPRPASCSGSHRCATRCMCPTSTPRSTTRAPSAPSGAPSARSGTGTGTFRRTRLASMPNVLVVANRTAECEELQQALKDRASKGDDVKFTLIVPAAHGFAKAANPDQGFPEAQHHVDNAVKKLREA